MVEDLTRLSLVESEMLGQSSYKCGQAHKNHKEGHVTVTMSIKWIVTKLITIWFVVGIWLVHDQICVRIWRENVLVAVKIKVENKIENGTY